MGIPKLDEPIQSGEIPLDSAELPQDDVEPELIPYLISFQRYNRKECKIEEMEAKSARKAFKVVRDIGMKVRTEADFKVHFPKLVIAPVEDIGAYRDLFRGLRDSLDIEMKELKFETDKGRLFFFVIDKIFHVVAVRDSHYEVDKR